MSGITEKLYAENAVLRYENTNLKIVLQTRKARKSGKRLAIDKLALISTEKVYLSLHEAEMAIWKRENKRVAKKPSRTLHTISKTINSLYISY